LFAALLAVWGAVFIVLNRSFTLVTGTKPFDLDINLVAARRLVGGRDLYDNAASRIEGIRHVSSTMRVAYHDTFSGFIGAPIVAAAHVPFRALSHHDAVAVFRIMDLVAIVVAVAFAVCTVPRSSRTVAALVGFAALALSYPLVR